MTAIVASVAAGERDEAAEDDPVPDLVLRAADDDDGTFGHVLDAASVTFPRGYRRRHCAADWSLGEQSPVLRDVLSRPGASRNRQPGGRLRIGAPGAESAPADTDRRGASASADDGSSCRPGCERACRSPTVPTTASPSMQAEASLSSRPCGPTTDPKTDQRREASGEPRQRCTPTPRSIAMRARGGHLRVLHGTPRHAARATCAAA